MINSRSVLLAGLCMTAAIAPLVSMERASAQVSFQDIQSDYWAKPYIEALAAEKIITGFPDGNFRPNNPVTRAQFASIIQKAFSSVSSSRRYRPFVDVSKDYWAEPAIKYAYTREFISGAPSGEFDPERKILKEQALVSLASGLKLKPSGSIKDTLAIYSDASKIPFYAQTGIAAATQKQIPVNYPDVKILNPSQEASRADVAAYIYQALVSQGKLRPIAANLPAASYIVGTKPIVGATGLAAGTEIPVILSQGDADKNLVMTVGESLETMFTVSQDIFNGKSQLIIPKGSQIKGRFQPVRLGNTDGTQFTATQIIIGNKTYPLNASSAPIAARKQDSLSAGDITGSLSTVAASTLLQSLLGGGSGLSIDTILPTLLQVGQQIGPKINPQQSDEDTLILVEPGQLGLKLNDNFAVSSL